MKKERLQKETMGSLFHKWLLILTIGAFVTAFCTTQYLHRRQSETQAERSLVGELSYVKEQIIDYKSKEAEQKRFAKEALLSKAFAVAKIISVSPTILNNRNSVQELANLFSISELNISDGNGLIIRSTKPELENTFNYHDHPETKIYLALITGEVPSIAEDPRQNADTTDGIIDWKQYAGVPRTDKKGIVQIGYSSEQYNITMASVSIENFATNYSFSNSGALFILNQNKNGKIVSSTSGTDKNKTLTEAGISSYKPSKRVKGFYDITINGTNCLAQSDYHDGFFILTMLPYTEIYRSGNILMLWITLFYSILFAAIYLMISNLLNKVVIRGFTETNEVLNKIVSGNLNEKVEVATTSEFVSLSHGINTTVDALNKAITEAAHRMDKDLELSRAIQISALPNATSPFPEHKEFDIYATMKTAREVGGDFYDFFFIGTDCLGFVIADVSGKGIPASLFMMSAKTELKNCMSSEHTLSNAIVKANNTLCENNEAGMFVTAFTGILNYKTGELRYVNGGHNFPLIRHNGTYEWLSNKSGLILGLFSGKPYKEYTRMLSPGDMIYLYTDGVTEAMNIKGELYGNNRLVACLNGLQVTTPEEVLPAIAKDVDKYADGAPQADDITMLALTYIGKTN